jgi:hypothetical protein
MHEDDDIQPENLKAPEKEPDASPELAKIERQSIHEAIASLNDAQLQERIDAERAARRREHEEKTRVFKVRRTEEARRARTQRVRALVSAEEKVQAHVAAASRSIRAAIRELTDLPLPRHSREAREQRRAITTLGTALGSLRAAGRRMSVSEDADIDPDLDLDVG